MSGHETRTTIRRESGLIELDPSLIHNPERERAVYILVQEGLDQVEFRYGPESSDPHAFHNADHARDGIDAFTRMAEMGIRLGKITPDDKDAGVVALCWHDLEQNLGSGFNEAESARKVCHRMKELEVFTEEDIVNVYKMIMATVVRIDGSHIYQSADQFNILTQYAADADMATFGRPTEVFWDRALRYFTEISTKANKSIQDLMITFALSEESVLENHEFYTDEARELFPHKEDNIRFTRFIQQYYASGQPRPLPPLNQIPLI